MRDRKRETPLRTLLLLGWDQFLPRLVVGSRARPRGNSAPIDIDTDESTISAAGGTEQHRVLSRDASPDNDLLFSVESGIFTEPLRRGVTNDLPLSFAQERLWFLDRLDPGISTFNVPVAVRMRGTLDARALEYAFSEVVRRHDTLRTRFTAVDGEPAQRIEPPDVFRLRVDDLTLFTASQAEEEVARRAAEDAYTPFDLETGPVFRATLLRVSENDHVLLVATHRIVCDEWSREIFWGELAALYSACLRGEPSPLPELPVRYADFAAWQRDWLSRDRLEGQLAWWKAHLAGAPTILELPTDRPRPAVQSHRGGDIPFALPVTTAAALRELAAREGATPFMVVLAAWSLLLSRWSGQDDVVVGTPVAGRARAEVEPLIGLFVNTLAIRTDVSDASSFCTLLARVREAALGAYAHQDLPFELLMDALGPERSLGYSPVYQVALVMQNTPERPGGFPALDLTWLEHEGSGLAKVDLTLTMVDRRSGGMAGVLTYSADLWDAETIARMAGHLSSLLHAAVEASTAPVFSLDMLSSAERVQVVETFNTTEHPGYAETLIHQRVTTQAARTPNIVAVEMADARLTYAQVEARTNRLARRLAALGVRPGMSVAICLERSLDLPVTVLAVLKAGGAYVAVHPSCPAERVAYILNDSSATVVVTTSDVAAWLPLEAETVLQLDQAADQIAQELAEPLDVRVDADDLCYVLYTSGSTGRPKAAGLPHRVLANLLRWQVERAVGLRAARTLQFASLSFDVSFQEIFGAWTTGGTLVLVDEETRRDAERLLAHLRRERVERVFLPFAALQNLAEVAVGADAELPHLREVVTAGEALHSTPQLRAFFLANPKARLDNHYGPSETHVVTAHRVEEDPDDWPLLPPIGTPIDNVRVYVMDAALSPVPVGVPGQLYAGGACLARGYLGCPALTADRFVPNPQATYPGERLYRTGDRARWRPNGTLEFLGRMDDQVKVRGFRVEPGEVEAVLCEHPGVGEVVVVARGEGADRRLVGYVVPIAGTVVDPTQLRSHLAERLPDYMVPAAWVMLERMPLTPSGKVDRRALPEPLMHSSLMVAPRTAVEEMVASVWKSVLGLEQVSVEDNFFSLGGHSLLVVQVVARLREEIGVSLPLISVFTCPTIAALATEVESLMLVEALDDLSDEEIAALLVEKEGRAESA